MHLAAGLLLAAAAYASLRLLRLARADCDMRLLAASRRRLPPGALRGCVV